MVVVILIFLFFFFKQYLWSLLRHDFGISRHLTNLTCISICIQCQYLVQLSHKTFSNSCLTYANIGFAGCRRTVSVQINLKIFSTADLDHRGIRLRFGVFFAEDDCILNCSMVAWSLTMVETYECDNVAFSWGFHTLTSRSTFVSYFYG